MRFLHLSDLHLGRSLAEFDLLEDQKVILQKILAIADEKKADAVVIAGDVYDRPIPSEGAVMLFDWFLCSLAKRGMKVFVISGNHDSDERLHFASSLLEAREVYIAARYDGTLFKKTFQDEYGPINIFLMPFVKASQVRHFFPKEEIASYDDAVRVLLGHAGIDPGERNVLAAHQFVTGDGGQVNLDGSESSAVQHVGLVEKISYTCFDAFDYVALGHIHSAQQVGRACVRYAGSPLKYSLSEEHGQKSVTFVEMGEKGSVNVEKIPLKPRRDLRHIKGPMEKLLAKENVVDEQDFIIATLTDEQPVDNAMSIFQRTYPNTVRIRYENSHTKAMQEPVFDREAVKKKFDQLFAEFYQEMYGCELSGEERSIIEEAAKEAGIHEAS